MTSHRDKCETFAALHRREGAFLIPNPFDTGSARVLQALGFPALATTSAGFAQTLGRVDGQVRLDEKLAHCRALAEATDIPINVDFEDGYARTPEEVHRNVTRLAATGVAGCSIEDYDREAQRMIGIDAAVERLQAAAAAVAAMDVPFMLTARAEVLLRRAGDLDETIRRLQAYERAGADVLYAPALKTLEELQQVAAEVTRPINALGVMFRGATVAELADAGAKRISVGSALADLSMGPVIAAGRELLERGTFGWLAGMPADLDRLLQG
jgi:2-methylisocitrate lyase-like PEP mutase family enzyme